MTRRLCSVTLRDKISALNLTYTQQIFNGTTFFFVYASTQLCSMISSTMLQLHWSCNTAITALSGAFSLTSQRRKPVIYSAQQDSPDIHHKDKQATVLCISFAQKTYLKWIDWQLVVIVSETKPGAFLPQHFQLHKRSSAKTAIMPIIEHHQSMAV